MMRQHRWIICVIALLLGACGAQPEQPAAAPTAAAVTAAPTSAPTAAPATSAPQPTAAATASAAAPTEEVFRAEPTAQLILPPTGTPAQATAAPKPTAKPEQPAPASAPAGGPTRLVIEDIKLDYKPKAVGLDKNRVPIVLDHDVAWYNLSAGPGQGENIVMWGHVLRFRSAPKIPAPFARLKEVKPGAQLVLYDQDGQAHNYVVKQQVWVEPNEVKYILPQGKEMVTLVSCIGDKVISDGGVVDESHRLITIAEPA
jgi:LPXTG-site transpeptidase (sortase) family protein